MKHYKPWHEDVVCGADWTHSSETTSNILKVECRACLLWVGQTALLRLQEIGK